MRKSSEKSFKSDIIFSKTSIILMILFINICLMIPVWQSANNSQLKRRLSESEALIKENEEQRMIITASIASKMTPEYLIEQSVERNIVFKQIGGDNTVGAVANSNVGLR